MGSKGEEKYEQERKIDLLFSVLVTVRNPPQTNVEVIRIVTWHQSKHNKREKAKTYNPNAKKEIPKIILIGCWIFGVKDKDVSDNVDGIDKENVCHSVYGDDNQINVAKYIWDWIKEVTDVE